MTCEALPDISNGGVSLSGTQFASVATYSCDVGYRLEEEMERTCLSNGSWSDTTPLCQGLFGYQEHFKPRQDELSGIACKNEVLGSVCV